MNSNLKVVTFNVNGIRSIKEYYSQSKLTNYPTFELFLDSFQADILCFQEHKTNTSNKLSHDLSFPKGYSAYYAFPKIPKKIGYSGAVTFVKNESLWSPIGWYDGFSGVNYPTESHLRISPLLKKYFSQSELEELDSEGRCMITDHFHFLILNIYFPNDSGPERAEFRSKFYQAVRWRCFDLIKEHGKSIILLGDINISYHPLDHCEYASGFKILFPTGLVDISQFLLTAQPPSPFLTEFYSNPMRRWLAEWLFLYKVGEEGVDEFIDPEWHWIDCFRSLNPYNDFHDKYTCWNTQISARGTNFGTRIDGIFISGPLFINTSDPPLYTLQRCSILPKIMGSDHCPVEAQFSFPESIIEINATVLKDIQLKNGNIPKNFSRMDSFFSVKVKLKETDIITVNNEDESKKNLTQNDTKIVTKRKISDFFSSVKTKRKTETDPENEKLQDEEVEGIEILTEISESDDFAHASSQNDQQSKSDWSNLFNKQRPAPLCHHNEPCIVMKVKKVGPNRGRSFYLCPRPIGPATDPQARCKYFEWVNGK